MEPTQDIREKFGRFRILVVGRANAGKTTLLQRICNTTEKPEIFDREGNKIGADVVQGTVNRGCHNIENELVFTSNQGFVFHDSCGFEAGGKDEFTKMKKFVLDRASTTILKERIHAIWYCIPMDECHRAITKAEEGFFSECDTRDVPVIAVFTKFDALLGDAYAQLRRSKLTRKECSNRASERAKEIFDNAKIWDRLCETQYPPKGYVCMSAMEKDSADCGPLLESTTSALGEEARQMLLISTQQTNMALCIKYAVEKVLIIYIGKARRWSSVWLSKDTHVEMRMEMAAWFPHMKEWSWRQKWCDSKVWKSESDRFDLFLSEDLENKELERNGLDPTLFAMDYTNAARIGNISNQVQSVVTKWPFSALMQTIQHGIAATIILEHSFTLLQQGEQDLGETLALAAGEYMTSQTQAAVDKAVKEVLYKDDGGDDKLSKMIIDIILKNRMSKVNGVRK